MEITSQGVCIASKKDVRITVTDFLDKKLDLFLFDLNHIESAVSRCAPGKGKWLLALVFLLPILKYSRRYPQRR